METVEGQELNQSPSLPLMPAGEAGGTLANDLRAVESIWRRELIRFYRHRLRIVTSLVQPLLFLFVLGSGLSPVITEAGHQFDFRTFLFPGALAMAVLFPAIMSAVSIVWDREFGFLREMLVAPVSRTSLVVGKCLGGATVATCQGVFLLCLAGLVGVPYDPVLLATIVVELAVLAIVFSAVGILLAGRIAGVDSFQAVLQFFVVPMFFLSGALFPLQRLPSWLGLATKLNPLTYGVDLVRRSVFARLSVPDPVMSNLSAGVTWNGWILPMWFELSLVLVLGVTVLMAAVREFSKAE